MINRFKCLLILILFSIAALHCANAVSSRFEYNSLDDRQRVIYDRMYKAVMRCEESIEVSGFTDDEYLGILTSFLKDHPGVFWVEDKIWVSECEDCNQSRRIAFFYNHQDDLESDKNLFIRRVEEMHERICGQENDWLKLLGIYDTIASSVTYDMDFVEDQSMWSALTEGHSVCLGIAKLFQYLALMEGIPCILVYGSAIHSGNNLSEEPHAWCKAKLFGKWYNFDPTWAMGSNGKIVYSYFCRSDEKICRSHSFDGFSHLPESGSDELNYFLVKDRFFESYDRNRFSEALKVALSNDEPCFSVEFSEKNGLEMAMVDLIENKGIFELLESFGCDCKSIKYSVAKTVNALFFTIPSCASSIVQ